MDNTTKLECRLRVIEKLLQIYRINNKVKNTTNHKHTKLYWLEEREKFRLQGEVGQLTDEEESFVEERVAYWIRVAVWPTNEVELLEKPDTWRKSRARIGQVDEETGETSSTETGYSRAGI